jgi:hypothetical protein
MKSEKVVTLQERPSSGKIITKTKKVIKIVESEPSIPSESSESSEDSAEESDRTFSVQSDGKQVDDEGNRLSEPSEDEGEQYV